MLLFGSGKIQAHCFLQCSSYCMKPTLQLTLVACLSETQPHLPLPLNIKHLIISE